MDTLLAPFAVPASRRASARHCHREVAPHLRRARTNMPCMRSTDAASPAAAAVSAAALASRPLFADLAAPPRSPWPPPRARRGRGLHRRAQVPTNRSSASTTPDGAPPPSPRVRRVRRKNASTMVGTPPLTPAASEPCNDRRSAPSAPRRRARRRRRPPRFSAEPSRLPRRSCRGARCASVSQASADAAIAPPRASSTAVDTAGGISVTVSPVTSSRARKRNRPATRDVTRRRHCARSAPPRGGGRDVRVARLSRRVVYARGRSYARVRSHTRVGSHVRFEAARHPRFSSGSRVNGASRKRARGGNGRPTRPRRRASGRARRRTPRRSPDHR